jgi:hypothetical protein
VPLGLILVLKTHLLPIAFKVVSDGGSKLTSKSKVMFPKRAFLKLLRSL